MHEVKMSPSCGDELSWLVYCIGSMGVEAEDDDDDYLPMDEVSWKKNIQIGDDYQADIPDLLEKCDSNTHDTCKYNYMQWTWVYLVPSDIWN